MKKFKTEQENFWAGKFGDKYIGRNNAAGIIAGNLNLFSNVFENTGEIKNVIEFGSNIGQNLVPIKKLLPHAMISAVEINKKACIQLRKSMKDIEIINKSILEYNGKKKYDFVFTKGVLIHLNPNILNEVYSTLYNSCSKYIFLAEYYNPEPVTINYRGNDEKLFKRDFAGEMLKKFKDLSLVKYGFKYHLDNNFPQDDINWFLLGKEKK